MDFKMDIPSSSALNEGEEKDVVFDMAILGGGPAGLTAAVYAMRKQMSVIMISPDLGGQVLKTSGIENYMGFQYITGAELSQKFSEQAQLFSIKRLQESAIHLKQIENNRFVTRTDGGREITSRTLILATGKRWRKLNIPGEELYLGHGVVNCAVCDAPFFKGLPVVVAGGGNSAASAALDLIRLNCKVTLVNYSPGWQADPVLMKQLQGRVELLDQHQILEIQGEHDRVTGVKLMDRESKREHQLETSGVFIEIGLIPNTEVFKGFVALNEYLEISVDCATRTSRRGVFAAGDCTSVPEKQIIIAAGEGAKAALAAYHYITFQKH
jgi:alkyl hydroperoxide reductase subunit F